MDATRLCTLSLARTVTRMRAVRTCHRWAATALALACLSPGTARAQAPTLPTGSMGAPGSTRSTLGPLPGAGGNPFGLTPGTDAGFLGGRPGPSFPRVPSSISTPGGVPTARAVGIAMPSRMSLTSVPLYGSLEIPDGAEEEGPGDGLTLDVAIERMLRDNLALQALSWQIPTARADVLQASLRSNPILYADAQLVPYGQHSEAKPGGPPQYDVNINHPVDYSGRRRARTAAAERVVSVVEAQYQDAARIQLDNLYTVFVDVLAARETLRFAKASEAGMLRQVAYYQTLFDKANLTRADVARARGLLEAARVGVIDAEEMVRRTRRTLGLMLNLPAGDASELRVRGRLADVGPDPPPLDELSRIAVESRPDLIARRLGFTRAEADVRLARADRFGEAYVLYQPYTFQDLATTGTKSATSWAFGLTVPVPLFNRNQGGVARTRLNAEQARVEIAAAERRVVAEVRDAERQYNLSKLEAAKIETELLPTAQQMRDDARRLFNRGSISAIEADNVQKEYNQVVRRYRDTLVKHRRSMLSLNTAVGRRCLP